jgi:hypothetical protein
LVWDQQRELLGVQEQLGSLEQLEQLEQPGPQEWLEQLEPELGLKLLEVH